MQTIFFHRNAGGWFGSQFGGTCWLLTGLYEGVRSPIIAAVWLACFVASNLIGLWLWRQRAWLRPYVALQLLLATCGVAGIAAFASLQLSEPADLQSAGWPRHPYLVLLIVPVLMAWFAMLERSARMRAQ